MIEKKEITANEACNLFTAINEFGKANPELPVGLIYALNKTQAKLSTINESINKTRQTLIATHNLNGVNVFKPEDRADDVNLFLKKMNEVLNETEEIEVYVYKMSDLEESDIKTLKLSTFQDLIFKHVLV